MKQTDLKSFTTKDWCLSFAYILCASCFGSFAVRLLLTGSYVYGLLAALGALGGAAAYLALMKRVRRRGEEKS